MVRPGSTDRTLKPKSPKRSVGGKGGRAQTDKERLQQLANNVLGILYQFQLDPDGLMSFSYISPGCREILGLEPETIERDASVLMNLAHPDDLESLEESIILSAQTLQPWHWEGRLILPNGQIKWMKALSQPECQPNGTMTWDGWFIDISDRKQAEEALEAANRRLRELNEILENRVEERTAQLCESETRLRTVMAAAPVILFALDRQGNFTLSEGKRLAVLGLKPGEVVGQSVYELYQDFPEILGQIQRVLAGEELRTTNRIGNFFFDVQYSPLRDERGEVTGLIGVSIDVSDRIQAEEEMKKSQQRLSRSIEQTPVAVIEWNQNWEIIAWNPAAEKIFGYSDREIIGRQGAEMLVPEEERERVAQIMTALIARGGGTRATNENLTKDGRTIICDWYNAPLLDERGKLTGVVSMVMDISERQKVEMALQHSEIRFRTLVENLPGVIYRCQYDADRTADFISEAIAEISGYPISDFVGNRVRSLAGIVHPEDRAKVNCIIEQAIAARSFYALEYRLICADGSLKWVSEKGQGIFDDDGQLLGLDGVIFDISDRKTAETELLQTRRFLSSVLENLPVGVAVKEAQELRFVFWNTAATEILGYSAEEVLGKNDYNFFPQEQADFFVTKDREVLQCGRTLDIPQETVRIQSGESKILHTRKTPILDARGTPQYLLAIIEDITEEKQAKEALMLYKHAVESTSDAIAIADAKGNHFYQNPAFSQLLEHETVEDFQEFGGIVRTYTDSLIMQDIFYTLNCGKSWQGEVELRSRSGRRLQILLRANPIKDATGQIIAFLGSHTDISDRKMAEEALRDSEKRFRDVSEAAGEYLWEMDAAGTYTFVTDKAKSVKGYAPSELIGHKPFEFMPPEDVEGVKAILQVACEQKSNFQLEHRDVTASGEVVWEQVNGVPMLDDNGEIIGFRGAGLSITERKQVEIQLKQQAQDLEAALRDLQRTQSQLLQSEKMSSLGQLVAGVAHEINNPINFIHGNLAPASDYAHDLLRLLDLYEQYYPHPPEAIQDEIDAIDLDFLKEDLTKLLNSMRVGTDRIREIVLSLRNFSRLDEAEFKTVNIHEGINSTLMILQNRLKAKAERPAIEVEKHYGQLPDIECYPGQLNQVLMNILVNAIDALDERDEARSYAEVEQAPSVIQISTEVVRPGWARICIADNGPGIPEPIRNRIFDPFFTTKTIGKGTGLGMSISYQIITEKHNGSIQCISSPDRGTEFAIEIPLRQ